MQAARGELCAQMQPPIQLQLKPLPVDGPMFWVWSGS